MADNKKASIIYETQEALYTRAVRQMEMDHLIIQFAFKEENYRKAAELFEEVGDYLDAPQLAEQCRSLADGLKVEEREYRYNQALAQKAGANTIGGYEKAEKMFREVAEYKDSTQHIEECRSCVEKLKRKKKLKKAGKGLVLLGVVLLAAAYFMSPQWKLLNGRLMARVTASSQTELPSVKKANQGEVALFGDYQWYVLEKDKTSATLIMYHAEQIEMLRFQPYNKTLEETDWENCSLREWLNGEFLDTAFTEKEKAKILTTDVKNEDNKAYGTAGGADTQDKVYLLSAAESEQYKDILKNLRIEFWLRTPGNSPDTASYLSVRMKTMEYGYPVDSMYLYTCPVIRVSL